MKQDDLKRVLSIDMDIIAWKCIQLYNDRIPEIGERRELLWDILEEKYHLEDFLKVEDDVLAFIKNLIMEKAKKVPSENIMFGIDHDMILELLCSKKEQAGEMLEIINIDHHHDIYYEERQKEETERFDYASLASWVYYLACNGKVDKYYWINDEYSCEFPYKERVELDFPMEVIDYRDYDLKEDFDYIFVSLSPEFLPRKYWNIFFNLKDEVEKLKGSEITFQKLNYCENGKTRHIAM